MTFPTETTRQHAKWVLHCIESTDDFAHLSGDVRDTMAALANSVIRLTEHSYEYCVMHPNYPEVPHRGPFLHDESAERWVQKIVDRAGSDLDFYVARRQVGPWERA